MRVTALLVASPMLAFLAACSVTVEAPPTEPQPQHEQKGKEHSPVGAVLRWQSRKDEQGKIPEGALYREATALQQRLKSTPLGAGGPSNWQVVGPGNIGGRIRSVVFHPTNPSIMYVGSVSGGVWKTTNGGGNWTMLPDFPVVIAVTCMVIHPTDPNTIYAGTGEQSFFDNVEGSSNSAVNVGAGVFKTTDGGNTWAQIPSTAGPAWNSVNRLTIDRNSPLIMVAATISGIFRSTDGGVTWSQRTTGKTLDVDIDPANSSRYVAGRADGFAQYSTDGGVTWTNTAQFPSGKRVETTYARANPGTVYAAVTRGSSLWVYRSVDNGVSYSQQSQSSVVSILGNYTGAIWVDPTNSNYVVVGGLDLYRSTNGGTSFSQISRWSSYPRSAHADHHMILEHPAYDGVSNRTVYFTNDGGIQRATDVRTVTTTSGWTNLAVDLAITQLYGCCVNATSGVVLGGAQDNGTSRGSPSTGLNGWTQPGGGDGSYCAADPNDPNYFYMQSQFIGLSRSSNGGASSGSSIKGSISEPSPNFMAYILLDPNDSNRLYVCGAALWRTNNAKLGSPPTWTNVKPSLGCFTSPPAPPNHYLDNPPCNISTVAVAQGDSNVVWVGHNNGNVYYTTNALSAAPTWTRVDTNTPGLPDRWVSRIAIDHSNHNQVTISFLGYAANSVWRTTNNGASWTQRTGTGANTLPPVPVSCIVQHRVLSNRYYAATDLGLFYSEDNGANWLPATGGPGIVPIDELVWRDDKTLMVATHGRSIWSCDIDAASVKPVGTGCGITSPPSLTASPPKLGGTQIYTLTNAAPNAPVNLLVAAGPPSPIVIGPCTIQPSLTGTLLVFSAGSTNGTGTLIANAPIPGDPAFLGAVVTAQDLIAVLGGPLLNVAELSNGLEMTLGF